MKCKFLRVVAMILCLCLAASGCKSAPVQGTDPSTEPTETTQPSPTESTGQITVEGQGTIPTEPENVVRDWTPVVDEDGTYHFGVADQECTAKLLTDFSVGQVTLAATYGKYEFSNGIIKVRTQGQFADSYDNYKGDDLVSADYANADYIGIRIKNNQSNEVYFGLQGVASDNRTIFLSGQGENIILGYDDGRAYRAPTTYTTYRNTVTIPAKFEGCLLIPVSRI